MTLREFLENKVNEPFTFEIEADRVILRFDVIPSGTTAIAINIADSAELKLFSDLLDGRVVYQTGNKVESGASISVFTIDKL